MKIHKGTYFGYGLYVLAILSLAMLIISNKFYVNDLISHPQFGKIVSYSFPLNEIIQSDMIHFFRTFFVLDFVWAALLLYYANQWLLRMRHDDWQVFIAQVSSVLAYLADCIENINYLMLKENSSSWIDIGLIENVKIVFYAIVFVILFYHVMSNYVFSYMKEIFTFIKTSILSLLIILIITGLILFVAQGGTIMVDLFKDGWNILILFFFMNYLALILSHYPAYFQRQVANSKFYDWNINYNIFPTFIPWINSIFKVVNFGVITFNRNKETDLNDEAKENGVVGGLRKIMGVLFFAVWLIILWFIVTSFEMRFHECVGPFILTAAAIIVYAHIKLENVKHNWSEAIHNISRDEDERYEDLDSEIRIEMKNQLASSKKEVLNHAKRTPYFLYAFLISLIITCVIISYNGWHVASIIAVTITSIFNAFYFTYFRVFRSIMQEIYTHYGLWDIHKPNDGIPANHDKHGFNSNLKPNLLLKYLLVNNANNHYYVKFLMFMLWVTIGFLLLVNFNTDLAQCINPMSIILAYLIAFYGIIAVTIKHFIYYYNYKEEVKNSQSEKIAQFKWPLHKRIRLILCVMVTFLLLILYSSTKGNDLHELEPEKIDSDAIISNEQFLNAVPLYSKANLPFNRTIQVAAYGGGLKSHLWTMLVLDKLQDTTNGEFIRSTISLSGVSGGAVGIGNFSLIQSYKSDEMHEDSMILALGLTNVLGIDLVSLFGRDMVREWYPSNKETFNGVDRSYLGMKVYSKIIGMDEKDFENRTFLNEWANLFRKDGYFPNLIFNSTSTKSRYGVSSAIHGEGMFPGSIDLVEYRELKDGKKASITFYDAVSTTNRFPFLSPAAKIKEKGHFVDGGYFENSGILSSNSFYKFYISERNRNIDSTLHADTRKRLIVNIINGKGKYIEEKFAEFFETSRGKDQAEIGAILATVAGTEGLPTYFIDQAKSEDIYQAIFLPHKVTYDEVCAALGGVPKVDSILIASIEKNNEEVEKALEAFDEYELKRWGVVTPALSRLLSNPGVQYQRAMVANHKGLLEEIGKIKEMMY